MERLAGAVERFVCGSAGRVEVSKCRAVLGTAFAVVGRSWVVGVMTGSGCAGLRRLGLGVGRVAQTERSGVLRLCGFGCVGLAMSKGGERASMVALPQPAANGAFAVVGRSRVVGVMTESSYAGLFRLGCGVGFAWVLGWLRKRSGAECGACGGFFSRHGWIGGTGIKGGAGGDCCFFEKFFNTNKKKFYILLYFIWALPRGLR